MSEIEQLLAEQRAGGEYLDSSEFTLDSLRARQKLAEFQLPESGLWLVKLVQAAVALHAPSISIAFGKSSVTVRFEAPNLPEAHDLLNLVISGQLPQQPALLHLVTALRSCASATTEAIEWHSGSSRVKMDARVTLTSANQSTGFQVIASRPPRARSLSKTLATSISHLVRNTAEEYEAVAQRCWVCPIPVLLDGRPLQRGYDSPLLRGLLNTPGAVIMQYEKSQANLPAFCVGVRQIPPLPDRPTLAALDSHAEVRKPVLKQQTFFRWENEGEPIGAALTVQAYRKCPNRIDFVWDGAVVASHEMEWQLAKPAGFLARAHHHAGLRLIFAVEGQELDLTQFEVRDKAVLASQLFERVKPQLRELLDQLFSQMPQLYCLPLTPSSGKVFGVSVGVYAVGVAGVVGPWFLGPLGITISGAMYVHLMSYRSRISAALKALRDGLDE